MVEPAGFPTFYKNLDMETPHLSIGRSPSNDIIIADLHASRLHAELYISNGDLWVKDSGSKNLTYLDGIPVVGSRKVSDGDELRIAATKMKFTAIKS